MVTSVALNKGTAVRKPRFNWGILILLVAGLLVTPALAQTFPALTGRVVDAANILKPEERTALEAKLKAYEDKTTDQVVVATVRSLDGTSVEDYANRLFRHWQLGQRSKNNGVLLLISLNERKVRVEVGYGLESTLTDALSKIIVTEITAKFRNSDPSGGIDKGINLILSVLNDESGYRSTLLPSYRESNMGFPTTGEARETVVSEKISSVDSVESESFWLNPRLWLEVEFVQYLIALFLTFVMFLLAAKFGPKGPGNRSINGSSSSSSRRRFSGGGGSSGGGGASGGW